MHLIKRRRGWHTNSSVALASDLQLQTCHSRISISIPEFLTQYRYSKRYLGRWQNNINFVYGGKTETVPLPFDHSNFFMDDCLPFSPITLSHKTHEMPTVTGEYLLTEISPSRVMSFSMFIDPINDLKGILCFDQILELCFVASVLSNPFWFEHTLTLIKRK
jgi:hypothetical protein